VKDDQKPDLLSGVEEAISRQQAAEAAAEKALSEKKREDDERKQRISDAVKSFLDTIGVDKALEKVNHDVFKDDGSIKFLTDRVTVRHHQGGGTWGLMSGMGHTSPSHYDVTFFFAGYHYQQDFVEPWYERGSRFGGFYRNELFIGFAILGEQAPLTHFIVYDEDLKTVASKYGFPDYYQRNPTMIFKDAIGVIQLDTQDSSALDSAVEQISPVNTELFQTASSLAQKGLERLMHKRSKS